MADVVHRDLTRDGLYDGRMGSELVERYEPDQDRCLHVSIGHPCSHSTVTHSEPHTMRECPFRCVGDRVFWPVTTP